MAFKKNKFTADQFEKEPFYKGLKKKLAQANIDINDLDLHGARATRVRGVVARHVEIFLSGGMEIDLFIANDGDVVRLLIDNQIMNDSEDETPKELVDYVSREVVRLMKHRDKKALREQVDASQIDKLLEDDNDSEDAKEFKRLNQHKANITKGSGKFLVVDDAGQMLQDDGSFSLSTLYVKVFESQEDAKAEANENQVVKV